MDFSKFDARGKAETGKAFPILHPETLLPLVENDKPAMFIIRGNAAPSVQEAQRQALAKALQDAEEETNALKFTFEDLHQKTIKAALLLLAGFENVEIDGKTVTMENAYDFLNLVFPRVVKDDETGRLKIANKTFAQQVIERASELDELLGNV